MIGGSKKSRDEKLRTLHTSSNITRVINKGG